MQSCLLIFTMEKLKNHSVLLIHIRNYIIKFIMS